MIWGADYGTDREPVQKDAREQAIRHMPVGFTSLWMTNLDLHGGRVGQTIAFLVLDFTADGQQIDESCEVFPFDAHDPVFSEVYIMMGNGDDQVKGSGASDVIVLGEGNDLASGQGGDDLICGGPDGDYLRLSTTIHPETSKFRVAASGCEV